MAKKQYRVIHGWTVHRRLGFGGNGTVFNVSRETENAAMKVLHEKHWSGPRLARFRDEIDAMLVCSDIKGVLPIVEYNVPDVPSPENPPCFVMPIAVPIEKQLERSPGLRDVIAAVQELSDALCEMHGRGVSHRDIKPSNLFFLIDRFVLGDFGLVYFEGKRSITDNLEKLGPAHYIAPEMLNSAATAEGKTADVYSLVKTLWTLATGQRYPLPGHHRRGEAAYSLCSFRREPEAAVLDAILDASTQINSELRPSMQEFSSELKAWLNMTQKKLAGENENKLDLDLSEFSAYLKGVKERMENAKMKTEEVEEWRRTNGLRIREKFRKIAVKLNSLLLSANFVLDELQIDNVTWGFYVRGFVAYDPNVDWMTAGKMVGIASSVVVNRIEDNGYVSLTASHKCETRKAHGSSEDVLWQLEAKFIAESAEELVKIEEIEQGLLLNLRSCISEVIARSMQ